MLGKFLITYADPVSKWATALAILAAGGWAPGNYLAMVTMIADKDPKENFWRRIFFLQVPAPNALSTTLATTTKPSSKPGHP